MNATHFLALLPPMDGKKLRTKANGINADIRATLEAALPEAVTDVLKVAPLFKGATDTETAHNVWRFLKQHFIYEKDIPGEQVIKYPRASFRLRKNDCKSYSLAGMALLAANGFKVAPKYTAYTKGANKPTHVYVIAQGPSGQNYIVDGCYTRFNAEKPYTFSLPINRLMDVYTLSDNTARAEAVTRYILPNTRHLNNEQRALLQRYADARYKISIAERLTGVEEDYVGKLSQQRKDQIKKNAGKVGRGFLTFALGMGRGAFLSFIALNINGLATKMQKLQKAGKFGPVLDKWKKIGGIEKLLNKSIKAGAKKKALFLSKKARKKFDAKMKAAGLSDDIINGCSACIYDDNYIGVLPAVIAPIIAAAVPVLAAIIPVIAKAFGGTKGGEQDMQDMQEQGQELVQMDKEGALPSPNEADIPEPEGVEGLGDMSNLWGELGKLAGAGIEKLAQKVKAKAQKNKKLQKFVDVVDAGKQGLDDYATGVYLRQSGIKDAAKGWADKYEGAKGYSIPVAIGLFALLGIVILKRR